MWWWKCTVLFFSLDDLSVKPKISSYGGSTLVIMILTISGLWDPWKSKGPTPRNKKRPGNRDCSGIMVVNKPFIRPAISWGVGIGLVVPLDFPRELPSTGSASRPAGWQKFKQEKNYWFKFLYDEISTLHGQTSWSHSIFWDFVQTSPQRPWHRIFRPGKWNDAYACARHGVDPTP